MANTPPAAPRASETELTGNVLFYEKPEPLNAEHHAKLGLVSVEKPFGFAKSGHVIPMTVGEFAQAALCFPIIFAGADRIPLAVMGLNAGDNLFIKADGSFAEATYCPAYIRRYPFVLAGDETEEQMIVCIDRSSKLLSEKGETKLFDDDGQPSEYTKNAIKFCDDFEVERRRSMAFVQLLKDNDLLEPKQAVYTPQNEDGSLGQPQLIADYFAVTEERLKALSPEKLAELRDNGALGAIYAHLVSLTGWDRLMALAASIGPSALPRVAKAANA